MIATAGARAASVPWLLCRLKAKLTVNRIRTAKGGGAVAVMSALIAAGFGVTGALVVAATSTSADVRVRSGVLTLGATLLLLGWTVFPLITFGTDETLDPARLQLLPLSRRPLMTGLLGSSFVGIAPAAAVVVVAGAAIGYGIGPWFPITVAAAIVLLLLCAATARTLTTLLASRLTSRRGRDAMVIVASVLALAAQGLRFVRFGAIDPDLVEHVVDVVRWLPPGMLGHAIFDAHEGSYAFAIAETAAPALLVPVLLGVWGDALDRALTVVTGGLTEARREHQRDRGSLALLFERLPFIPANPMGAVASRDLKYVLRDPKRKVVLVNSILVGIGLPIYLAVTGGGVPPGAVLLSSVAGYIALLASMNQFGFDGAALWIDVIAGNRVRDEIVGKNVSLAVQVAPVMLAVGLLLAALSGGWAYLPASLVIGLAGLGAGLAVSDVVSVRYPQRVPDTRNPFGGGGAGQGCAAAMVAMLGLLVQQLILVPVGIVGLVIAFAGPGVSIVLAPVVAIYGYVVWRAGVSSAARWLFWRQPELLNAVDPRRSG